MSSITAQKHNSPSPSSDMLRRPVPPTPDRFSGSLAPNHNQHHHHHQHHTPTSAATTTAAAVASTSMPRRFSLRSIKRRSKSRVHDSQDMSKIQHTLSPPSTTPSATDMDCTDSSSTIPKRASLRSMSRHRPSIHSSTGGTDRGISASADEGATTDGSSLEHSQLGSHHEKSQIQSQSSSHQHYHHSLNHSHPSQQPLVHSPHGHAHMPLAVVGTERPHNMHLMPGPGGSNGSHHYSLSTAGIPTVPTLPRPRRMMFFREEGVMRVHASRKDRSPSIPDHVDPLALIRNIPVKAEGWLYLAVHAAPGIANGPIAKWMFRRSVMKRYAQLRGSVVLLYMSKNDPVREIFSPVGCAVSSADTVVNRKGTVEHNVNIAKNGFTIQLRLKSEADADLWAAVLRDVSMVRQPRLADFQMIAPIGEGASGKVFLVRDTKTGRKLALKCMSKKGGSFGYSASEFRHAVDERLAHEHMNNAEYIVKLRHALQTKDRLYLATEFCEGGDVYNFVDMRGGGVNEEQAKIITAQVVVGLRALHREGIVFRDLKPENVLLDREGRVRLADFGLCKFLDQTSMMTRTVCGTFSYAAAEILEDNGYGLSCDLWALGTFLYHIMIGRPPRVAASLAEARDNIFKSKEPIIWYSDVMSEEAMSLVTALIEVNPQQRLGCGSIEGVWEVSRHPFFRNVDWEALEQGRIPAVVKQHLPPPEQGDLRNFNQEEWRSIRMDADQDVPAYTESVLWPLRNLTTHPLPSDFVVSYAYSCETLTAQMGYKF